MTRYARKRGTTDRKRIKCFKMLHTRTRRVDEDSKNDTLQNAEWAPWRNECPKAIGGCASTFTLMKSLIRKYWWVTPSPLVIAFVNGKMKKLSFSRGPGGNIPPRCTLHLCPKVYVRAMETFPHLIILIKGEIPKIIKILCEFSPLLMNYPLWIFSLPSWRNARRLENLNGECVHVRQCILEDVWVLNVRLFLDPFFLG